MNEEETFEFSIGSILSRREDWQYICENVSSMNYLELSQIDGLTAKENHNFRYTQMYGKARMQMKVGLTFACMNLKKLAKILKKKGIIPRYILLFPKNLSITC